MCLKTIIVAVADIILFVPCLLKGHYVEIQTQNLNIYNINEVTIQNQKYLFFPLVNKPAVLDTV